MIADSISVLLLKREVEGMLDVSRRHITVSYMMFRSSDSLHLVDTTRLYTIAIDIIDIGQPQLTPDASRVELHAQSATGGSESDATPRKRVNQYNIILKL